MRTAKKNSRRFGFLGALIAAAAMLLASAAPATAAPAWRLDVAPNSTAAPGSTITYLLEIRNVGNSDADGSSEPIVLNGTLPDGFALESFNPFEGAWACPVMGQSFTCEHFGYVEARPNKWVRLDLVVSVPSSASGLVTSSFELSGGGAASPTTTVAPATITNASPQFGIAAFDAQVTANAQGDPYTQAGGHPYAATTWIDFNTFRHPEPMKGDLTPVEATKTIEVDLPPGFFGDPSGVDQCTLVELANAFSVEARPFCSPTSQVGVTTIRNNGDIARLSLGSFPVFNMVPPVNAPARFGFNVAGVVVTVDVDVRSDSDYGLTAHARNVSEGLAVAGSTFTLWGVPADPSHTPERSCSGEPAPTQGGLSCPSGAPKTAFLRNPTSCTLAGTGLPTTLRTDSWIDPGDFVDKTIQSHDPNGYPYPEDQWGPEQGPTGCEDVPFNPTLKVSPTAKAADSPSGLRFDLSLPQSNDPDSIATSDLRKAVVTLPAGMTVNPASANGLGACSSAQIGLDSKAPPACPDNSKIGEVEIETPALEDPLVGSVYLAKQGDNKFGSLLALYLAVEGQGVVVKLAGKVEPQADGRLITTFDNQPQVPFSDLHLELYDGPRAALRTPGCGTHTIQSELTPWSGGEAVALDSSFTITSGPNGGACATPFSPELRAGTASPIAGSYSPFSLRLTRADGSQEIGSLDVSLPAGLTGKLAGVGICPQAAIEAARGMGGLGQGAAVQAAPACPASSQVGTVSVGAGAGASPFYVSTGRVYLAGPYKGAPLSFAFVTPALAGPFDLGVVVVQVGAYVDPQSTAITAKAESLPSILHGIPLDLRDVRVELDRPGFMLNPTDCERKSIGSRVTSTQGATASPSTPFQMAECAALGFKPKLALRLKGKVNRGAHPKLIASLKTRRGDANIGRAQVKLPPAAFLDQSHIGTVCTRVQFAAETCPARSIYGTATATTPLLDYPVKGNVYLRSSSHELPDLVVAFKGPDYQPIEVELAGRTDSVKGALRNTFEVAPDVPVSSFRLELFGGKRGLIEMSQGFCQSPRATVRLDGQNGRIHDTTPKVKATCAKKAAKKRSGR